LGQNVTIWGTLFLTTHPQYSRVSKPKVRNSI
jgi:hypothetical protein